MKRIVTTALALLALVAVAAPAAAAAKPPQTLHYSGDTDAGHEIEFSLTGKRLAEISGLIMVNCVPTHGVPLSFLDEFHPPGSFVLGKSRKTTITEYMSYKGDVTKNITVDIKAAGKRWVADLHMDYSYEEVVPVGSGELEQHFYICQGDDSFNFKLESPKPKR